MLKTPDRPFKRQEFELQDSDRIERPEEHELEPLEYIERVCSGYRGLYSDMLLVDKEITEERLRYQKALDALNEETFPVLDSKWYQYD